MKKHTIFFILIILVGGFLRAPGLFWGLYSFPHLHPIDDELTFARISENFITSRFDSNGYPKGLSVQMGALTYISRKLFGSYLPNIYPAYLFILSGRLISFLYGLMTIILIYFFALKLTGDKKIALTSMLFLSLSGSHVAFSHVTLADVGLTFWIYASLFCSLIYMKKKKPLYLLLASLFTGFAAGMKIILVTLIPPVYLALKSKNKKFYSLLILSGFITGFTLINAFSYTPTNALNRYSDIINGNISTHTGVPRILNIPIILLQLIVSVGLPISLIGFYGTASIIKKLTTSKSTGLHSYPTTCYVISLPILLHLLMATFVLEAAGSKQLLPVIPLLIIIAANAFSKIKNWQGVILTIVILYQLIAVVSYEYNFIKDPRDVAMESIYETINKSKILGYTTHAPILLDYPGIYLFPDDNPHKPINKTLLGEIDYLILTEYTYCRCIKSTTFPLGDPDLKNVIIRSVSPSTCEFIQSLFRGSEPFKLVKKAEVKIFAPEVLAYKRWFGTPHYLAMDTLVYERTT